MRLVTYSRLGVPSIGLDLDNGILDIPDAASCFGRTYHVHGYRFPNTMIDLLNWESGIEVVKQILGRYMKTPTEERPLTYERSSVRLEAPVPRPGKIIAIGTNYKSHIKELGHEVPKVPLVFAKFPSSVIAPDRSISIPRVTSKLDWEVELAVVIGRICKDVAEKDALNYVAGYTIVNDLTARELQKSDVQWVRSKSLDGFCPMGPAIATADELGDGSGLRLYSKVNGVIKQDSNTSDLLFGVPWLVSWLSESFTLEPGDVIPTGTPGGVGFLRNPPEYLKAGDKLELYVDKIGYLKNTIVA
ncbi:MAG: FAA hydrolase family protein [Candidatus Thorarchaeota archaeon]|nr:MAG: FAA hydrolase family protein [Candidatus Thorarchaeota archaeon]